MLPYRALTDFETISAASLECADEIDIWWWPIGQSEPDWQEIDASLQPDERARAESIVHPADRQTFMAGRYLQRDVLSAYLGLEKQELAFVVGPHGKPLLADVKGGQALSFNLTNTCGLAVLAVSRSPHLLGVDAEGSSEAVTLDEAGIFCCENELQLLSGLRAAERSSLALLYWILKESALKATGAGFHASPTDLEITVSPDKTIAIRGLPTPGEGAAWWHGLFSLTGEYRIAVSAGGCERPLRIRQRRFSPHWRMIGD
jgi:4'-phosphopantetheinyl transferase